MADRDVSAGEVVGTLRLEADQNRISADAAKAMRPAEQQIERSTGVMGMTLSRGAVAGFAAWTTASAAFGAKASSVFTQVGKDTIRVSRLTGLATADASKLRFQAQQTGVDVDKLATGIRTLSKHLSENDDVARDLGFTYRDARGQLLPTDVLLGRLSDRFQAMPDGLEKTALATAVFGKAGGDLIPFLNKGSEGLADLTKQAKDLGLVLDDAAIRKVKDAAKAQRDLDAANQGLAVQIGEHVTPTLTSYKRTLTDIIATAAKVPLVGDIIGVGAVAGVTLGPVLTGVTAVNEGLGAYNAVVELARNRALRKTAANSALAASELAVAEATAAATAAQAASGAAGGGRGLPPVVPVGRGGLIARTALPIGVALAQFTAVNDEYGFFGGGKERLKQGEALSDEVSKALEELGVSGRSNVGERKRLLGESNAAVLANIAAGLNLKVGFRTHRTSLEEELKTEHGRKALTALDEALVRSGRRPVFTVTKPEDVTSPVVGAFLKDQAAEAERKVDLAARIERTAAGEFSRSTAVDPSALYGAMRGPGYAEAVKDVTRARDAVNEALNDQRKAERELRELRRSGKATTEQVTTAEERLAATTKTVADARERLGESEKRRTEAAKGSALSAAQVEKTLEERRRLSGVRAGDLRLLAQRGATADTLAYLSQEDAAHPGTLHRVASTQNTAYLRRLNADQADIRRTTRIQASALEDPESYRKAMLKNAKAARDELRRKLEESLPFKLHLAVREHVVTMLDPYEDQYQPARPARGSGFGPQRAPEYHIGTVNVVAQNPAEFAAQMERRARIRALTNGDGPQ